MEERAERECMLRDHVMANRNGSLSPCAYSQHDQGFPMNGTFCGQLLDSNLRVAPDEGIYSIDQ